MTKTEPFELVIHMDDKGTRATACYRTRTFDDAGVVIEAATSIKGVTLAELGDNFPWAEFVGVATKSTLAANEALTADNEAKATQITELETAATAKDAQIASLTEQVAALPVAPIEGAVPA